MKIHIDLPGGGQVRLEMHHKPLSVEKVGYICGTCLLLGVIGLVVAAMLTASGRCWL